MSVTKWEDEWAVDGVRSGSFNTEEGEYQGGTWAFTYGNVDTPHGIVVVDTYEDDETKATNYTFIYGGKYHRLSERGVVRGRRGAAIVAGRWVREIVERREARDGE